MADIRAFEACVALEAGGPYALRIWAEDPRTWYAFAVARSLRIGIPKGRVLAEAVALFGRAGINLSSVATDSRRLIHPVKLADGAPAEVLVLRASDICAYVEHGACDLGVAGYDIILEQAPDVFVPVDLGFGRCRLVVASSPDIEPLRLETPRIATKYPRIAAHYFLDRGAPAQIIELKGAIETAPLVDLADAIVDIVETGETLRKNGLVEAATIADITTRLVVNRAALRLHTQTIRTIQLALEAVLESPAEALQGEGS